ncbi:MAG: hypothetical protein H0W40_14795 [Methylibium sp.]|uniref:hypothetical protein n=1 Tax=Methylibium sp. TaxID=2067992 RepID=UPI001824E7D6|nr:hypothetical protein [Methylibium sp.]MBA3598624.1 hypothetical protein [Methylibium sp.]
MVTLLLNPLRRWWQMTFMQERPAAVPALVFRRSRARPVGKSHARAAVPFSSLAPLTPFRTRPAASVAVGSARRAAQRFWMTLDPHDQRRAAIGGSFAEVCAALERLAALEEGRLG